MTCFVVKWISLVTKIPKMHKVKMSFRCKIKSLEILIRTLGGLLILMWDMCFMKKYLFDHSTDFELTGNVKYVSGYGSFMSEKCHHSVVIALKPWFVIAFLSIIRLAYCSSVIPV